MPVQVYSADFRVKDGEVMSSTDLRDNFQGIQDAANALDWTNVEDGSLDQFHMKIGEPTKGVLGRLEKLSGATNPVGHGAWTTLVTHTPEVRVGSAVYAIANVTFDRLNSAGTARVTINPTVNFAPPSIFDTKIRIQGPHTSREHEHAHAPAVYGQASIVHAYQVTAQMVAMGGANHVVTFDVATGGPVHPYSMGMINVFDIYGTPFSTLDGYERKVGVVGNFVVFVIDR